jgi:hypothetical protein
LQYFPRFPASRQAELPPSKNGIRRMRGIARAAISRPHSMSNIWIVRIYSVAFTKQGGWLERLAQRDVAAKVRPSTIFNRKVRISTDDIPDVTIQI